MPQSDYRQEVAKKLDEIEKASNALSIELNELPMQECPADYAKLRNLLVLCKAAQPKLREMIASEDDQAAVGACILGALDESGG